MDKDKKKSILDNFEKRDRMYDLSQKTMSFEEYLGKVKENPLIARSAVQRTYDMIISHGFEKIVKRDREILRYFFFDDPFSLSKEEFKKGRLDTGNFGSKRRIECEVEREYGKDAIFGMEWPLSAIVEFFFGAAQALDYEKRMLLLHGPVSSSKSTVARLLKKGLEQYSKIDDGALYTFALKDLALTDRETEFKIIDGHASCPLNEDPLRLIPYESRKELLDEINKGIDNHAQKIIIEGGLCPPCNEHYKKLMEKYKGDWQKVLSEHVIVKRMVISEKDRIGIGTFKPKDEKNQDSTELTGDSNYGKLGVYGDEANPLGFDFCGEFEKANRGIFEWVEVLKLDPEFLYELLDGTQDKVIKPKNQANTEIDQVLFGHTNNPEYIKLLNNPSMEAIRDRVVVVHMPYVLETSNEARIYAKRYSSDKVMKHIAPYTLEIASLWVELTRVQKPSKDISLIDKVKLYDGKKVGRHTEEDVLELMKEYKMEGFDGISPRYIQNILSALLSRSHYLGKCINPLMIFDEIGYNLKNVEDPCIKKEDNREAYFKRLADVKKEYDSILKEEIMGAICSNEKELEAMFKKYRDNVEAFVLKSRIKDDNGEFYDPDIKFLRRIEEFAEIPEGSAETHRIGMIAQENSMRRRGKVYDYKTDERLLRAMQRDLYESKRGELNFQQYKDIIKNKDSIATSKDKEMLSTIVKKLFDIGYCEECADRIIAHAARIIK